jgi:hypothetical protein
MRKLLFVALLGWSGSAFAQFEICPINNMFASPATGSSGPLACRSIVSADLTVMTYTGITSLWTGTCNSSSFLRGDGSCQTISGGGNVTGSGLTTNANIIGLGGSAIGVVAGLTTDGTARYIAGVSTSQVGTVQLFGGTSGSSIITPPAIAGTNTVITLPNAASTLPIFPQEITFTGPTAARTVTLPDANITVARTDAANTFTGASSTTSWNMTTPVIAGGLTASGSGANTFAGSTGTFVTSSGANTITGAATFSSTLTSTSGLTSLANTTIAGPAATTALTLTQTARTSGVLPYIKYTIPTDTGQTAGTESPGIQGVTGTRTWATTGTIALQREIFFPGPTYASASASQTFTDVFNMYLTPPIAGTNAIFTRNHTFGIVGANTATSSIIGDFIVATTLGTAATSCGMGGGAVICGGAVTGNQLTSTVATGTAPLVVTSTTNVANLNAATLNGATFAAPGTIGGTTPSPTATITQLITTDPVATSAAAPTIASAATIAPTTAIAFVSGTTTINTITAPSPVSSGGGILALIPTGLWSLGTSGNIALACTATISEVVILTYDTTAAKWYPSCPGTGGSGIGTVGNTSTSPAFSGTNGTTLTGTTAGGLTLTVASGTNPAALALTGGTATTATDPGGAINITGGTGNTTGSGGAVTITGGQDAGTNAATAGNASLIGGSSAGSSSSPGNAVVQGGGGLFGAGGTASLIGGTGNNNSVSGGPVNVTGGTGGITANSGSITISTPNGGSSSGASGNIVMSTGTVSSGAIGTISFKPNSTNQLVLTSGSPATSAFTGTITVSAIASSGAAQTGYLCYNTSGGTITYDSAATCLISLEEFKDINGPITSALKEVLLLKPIWGSYKKQEPFKDYEVHAMFGARHTDSVDSRLTSHNEDGSVRGVRYQEMTALLTAAIQEQQKEIAALQKQVRALQKRVLH